MKSVLKKIFNDDQELSQLPRDFQERIIQLVNRLDYDPVFVYIIRDVLCPKEQTLVLKVYSLIKAQNEREGKRKAGERVLDESPIASAAPEIDDHCVEFNESTIPLAAVARKISTEDRSAKLVPVKKGIHNFNYGALFPPKKASAAALTATPKREPESEVQKLFRETLEIARLRASTMNQRIQSNPLDRDAIVHETMDGLRAEIAPAMDEIFKSFSDDCKLELTEMRDKVMALSPEGDAFLIEELLVKLLSMKSTGILKRI